MKVLISVDIEGVAGVSRPEQAQAGAIDYDTARRLMTEEANAAIRGAFHGGAGDVIVADAHGGFGNLVPDLLDARARLVHGKPRPDGMLQGLREEGVEAAMLVGYHAMAGARGVLAHTIRSTAFHRVALNGRPVGEAMLYGLLAGELGIPIVMCSGDDAFATETRAWLPHTCFAVVKNAIGNRAAMSLSPDYARRLIEGEAKAGLMTRGQVEPLKLEPPLTCRVEAKSLVLADLFAVLPGARRPEPLVVEFDAGRPGEVLGVLQLLSAASSAI